MARPGVGICAGPTDSVVQSVAVRTERKEVTRPPPSLSAKAPKEMYAAELPSMPAMSRPLRTSWPSLSAGETFS